MLRMSNAYSTVDYTIEDDGSWWIELINTHDDHRGQGHASDILQELCAYADLAGVVMTLEALPERDSTLTKQQVRKWYERYGFTKVAGPMMKRNPS